MILYHGTRTGALASILAAGLRPRGTRSKGNWKHSVTSNSRAVYLTNAYPLHFAEASAKEREDLLILEIDITKLDQQLLAPDEDFLEQATRGNPIFPAGDTMKARTHWFRQRAHKEFAHHWQDSLRGLGTCTYYGTIPVSAITRYAVIPKDATTIRRASDPTITILNYKIMGGYYRQLVRRIFDDPIDENDLGHMADHASRLASLPRGNITTGYSWRHP